MTDDQPRPKDATSLLQRCFPKTMHSHQLCLQSCRATPQGVRAAQVLPDLLPRGQTRMDAVDVLENGPLGWQQVPGSAMEKPKTRASSCVSSFKRSSSPGRHPLAA